MNPRMLPQPLPPMRAKSSVPILRPVALAMSVAVLVVILAGASGFPAQAAEAPPVTVQSHSATAVHQCNADTCPTGAGLEASCDVTIVNTLGDDGSTGSVVTTTWCLAEAGVLPPEGCETATTSSDTLVTFVDQCNGILAGGSNVTCRVQVLNNVPFGTPTTEVTVNQCVGSGEGGVSPDGPPTRCDPEDSSTTGATVTQCNGSANGGGAPERVQCTATGGVSALPLTVNQCNGSTAAGSTVTCDVTYTNSFAAAPAPPPTPPLPPTPPPPAPNPVVAVPSGPSGPAGSGDDGSSSRSTPSLPATGVATPNVLLLTVALVCLLLGSILVACSRRPGASSDL